MKKAFRSANSSGFAFILYAFLALLSILVIVISTSHTPYQNVRFFGEGDDIFAVSEGWKLYEGDKVWEVNIPSRNEVSLSGNTAILKNKLPETLPKTPTILFRTSLQEVKVYLEGELIYEYGGDKYRAFGKSVGSIWNVIPLSESDAGKDISLEIYCPYEDYKETFNAFYVDSYSIVMSFLISQYGFGLLLIALTMILGVSLLFYYLILKIIGLGSTPDLLLVALMTITTSLWEFTECKLTQWLVGNMAGFSACNFLMCAMMIIPMAMYADVAEKKHFHHILYYVEMALEINVLVQIVLQIMGVADFYEMITVTHILIALSAAVVFVTLIAEYIHHNEPGVLAFICSLVVLIVCGMVEIEIERVTGYVGGIYLIIGVMVVVITLGIKSVKEAILIMREGRRAVMENAQKSTFLANMSHEIRTPMNAICAMSELLMNAEDMNSGNRDFARTIHSSAENLLEIINDLLDFSKISANKYEIEPEEYYLPDLIDGVKEVMSIRTQAKHLDFNIHINPNLPYRLYGDMGRIRQILLNLLNNAVKFTEEGSVSLDVDYERCGGDEIKLKFAVKDTGIGIKEEDLNNLFEAFVQVDKARTRSKEGTGLGLAISKGLAIMMGGTIYAESTYGEGSVFTVTLLQTVRETETFREKLSAYFSGKGKGNLIFVGSDFEINSEYRQIFNEADINYVNCNEDEIDKAISLEKENVVLFGVEKHKDMVSEAFISRYPGVRLVAVADMLEKLDAPKGMEVLRTPVNQCDLLRLTQAPVAEESNISFVAPEARVMVVDDNVVNLRIMKELLSRYEISAKLFSDGYQALDAVKAKKYDLIFMDHMMPGIDGMEVTKKIREIPETGENVRIVALSANAIKGMDRVFKENGFDAFVAKPVSVEEVGDVLFRMLPQNLIQDVT